ncbi:DRAP deaminase [Dichotomocladium elegans]|nr:DRAP deaminase [Dichotomocladium elegans]
MSDLGVAVVKSIETIGDVASTKVSTEATADTAPAEVGEKRKTEEAGNEVQPKAKQRRVKQHRDEDFRDRNDLDSVEYIIENGLRKVKPYFFEYRAYAKGRWMKRPILNVFVEEFQDRNEVYYRHAIEHGLITINGEKVGLDYVIKNNDVLGHHIHRHEPVVTAKPIDIVHQDDSLLVINKPGGIPVHPAGRYRHNTVIHVLRKQLNIPRLFPANRLDRPTSGLMLIGLNSERARQFESQMVSGQIQKEYVCRVVGEFPDGEIVCEAPIKTISYKLSLNYVHQDGKACKTVFEKISYNGKTSVVRCRPKTGRTHQIRVHLRYLGFPIGNDPIYGNDLPWAPLLGKGQTLDDEASEKVVNKVLEESSFPEGMWEDKLDEESGVKKREPRCDECGLMLTPDPQPKELFIWLHAWRYAGEGWAYETELPSWAEEVFDDD